MEKIRMDFASSYKKKGIGLDNHEKRLLRVKRRSVDQRVHRDETFMRQRDIGSLTPLKETTDDNVQKNTSHLTTRTRQEKAGKTLKKDEIPKAVSVKAETAGTQARRNMLQKWKREKELKKKLSQEKERQKPVFKVYKVDYKKGPNTSSTTKTNAPALTKPQIQKDTTLAQRRVTRASIKASTIKPVSSQPKPTAPVAEPAKRVTRQATRLASKNEDHKENRQILKLTTRTGSVAKHPNKSTVGKLATSPPPATCTSKLPSPSATRHVTNERGASLQDPELQQSFAPSHFTFNFQFEPMSPASTQHFLFPETAIRKGRCSTPTSACRRRRATSPVPLEISAIQSPKKPQQQGPPAKEESSKEDVSYFRNLLKTESSKLKDLCSKWEAVPNDTNLSEDVCGEIRSTIGKAQLLVGQRFKQFSGLVDNCEFGLGEKKTHCSDLTGFWDMIYFQVEDVMEMFASLDKLRANFWVKEETKTVPTKIKVKKVIKAKLVTKIQSAKDREAAKERLAAIKASTKARQTRAKASEQTVFEGGFFKVESPVRNPAPHCQAGSPFQTRLLQTSGSNANTPRVQGFTPKNARRSIQGKLCGPLSKLVLGEAITPTRQVATPIRKVDTPISKVDTPVSKVDTPVSKVDTPVSKVDTPVSKVDTPVSKVDTPVSKVDTPVSKVNMLVNQMTTPTSNVDMAVNTKNMLNNRMATPCMEGSQNDATPSVPTSTKSLFAKYLQPSTPAVVNLNKQAEDFMQTEPQQQLVDLGVRSRPLNSDPEITTPEPLSLDLDGEGGDAENVSVFADSLEMECVASATNAPRTRSRSQSGILLLDLSSPYVREAPAGVSKASISSVFTPPVCSASAPQIGDDLICFDSPTPVSSVEATRHDSANLLNGKADLPTRNIANATVRRSVRLRHHSACSPITADSLTDAKGSLYKPNVSMI